MHRKQQNQKLTLWKMTLVDKLLARLTTGKGGHNKKKAQIINMKNTKQVISVNPVENKMRLQTLCQQI